MADETPSGTFEGGRRSRRDTLLGVIRRFWRLWGFAVFMVVVLIIFREIVLPFIFAVLLAYLLAPLVRRLAPYVGRGGSVLVLYTVLIALLGLFFGVLLPAVVKDFARLRDAAPELVTKANEEWLPDASGWLDKNFGDVMPGGETDSGGGVEDGASPGGPASQVVITPGSDGSFSVDLDNLNLEIQESSNGGYVISPNEQRSQDFADVLRQLVAEKGGELTVAVGSAIQAVVVGVMSFLTKLVITFMLAAFILVDIDRVVNFVRSLVPREYRRDYQRILKGVDAGMAGVIRGQLSICLVNGALTLIGLLVLKVKYAFLLALLAAGFSLIPIFGTIVSSIPILIVALVSDGEGLALWKSLGMLAWIAGIHLIEANYLNPRIIGSSAHIHPVVVVFALLAGESVYGLTGALLAVPVASIIQTVFVYVKDRTPALAETIPPDGAPGERGPPSETGSHQAVPRPKTESQSGMLSLEGAVADSSDAEAPVSE